MATRTTDRAESKPLFGVLAPIFLAAGIASVVVSRSLGLGGARNALQRFRSSNHLRSAMLGRSKHDVLGALGPPRAAANPRQTGRALHEPEQGLLFVSDIWYYPAVAAERAAMAVHFEHGVAREFEFFETGAPAAR
jgi:hypothetical protein